VGLLLATPLQILVGDIAGLQLFHTQPAKAAAIEAHWDTNTDSEGAEWNIVAWPDKTSQNNTWALSIPHGLSLIVNHSMYGKSGRIKGFCPCGSTASHSLDLLHFQGNDCHRLRHDRIGSDQRSSVVARTQNSK